MIQLTLNPTAIGRRFLLNVPDTIEIVPDFYSGQLGTPVFGSVVFERGVYSQADGSLVNYSEVLIPSALLTISLANEVVTTILQGRGGSIKEYVTSGDYIIQLSAIITNENGAEPIAELNDLNTLSIVPNSVGIINKLLNSLGVTKVVIENINVQQLQGRLDSVQLTMNLRSDNDINLNGDAEVNI